MDATAQDRMKEFLNQKEKIGVIKESDLEDLSDLGYGSGTVVKKVRHKPTQLIMARKLIRLEVKTAIKEQILRELKVLHECNFPHVLGFYGAFHQDFEVNICMEYMDSGSVAVILKRSGRIPELISVKLISAVLKGLTYLLEKHAILHRDVKPSNILVSRSGEIKICDFGLPTCLYPTNVLTRTSSYASPERLQGTHCSVKSDIWSVGLSLMEMSMGIYPIPPPNSSTLEKMFGPNRGVSSSSDLSALDLASMLNNTVPPAMSLFEILNYIVNEPPPRLEHRIFSEKLRDFVDQCLKKNPDERADLETLNNHEWIRRYERLYLDISGWVSRSIDLRPVDGK